jgi:hypothetical protein
MLVAGGAWEEVANHRIAASYARRLILSGSLHAGNSRKRRYVITAPPYWNVKQAYEEVVRADESNRTNREPHQIG